MTKGHTVSYTKKKFTRRPKILRICHGQRFKNFIKFLQSKSIKPFLKGVWEICPRQSLYWLLYTVFVKYDIFTVTNMSVKSESEMLAGKP